LKFTEKSYEPAEVHMEKSYKAIGMHMVLRYNYDYFNILSIVKLNIITACFINMLTFINRHKMQYLSSVINNHMKFIICSGATAGKAGAGAV